MPDPEIEELLRRILEEEGSPPVTGTAPSLPAGYFPQPASYYQPPEPSTPPDLQPPDTDVGTWLDTEYKAALREYYDALQASKADTAPYFGYGTRPSQARLTNAQRRVHSLEAIKKVFDKPGRTSEQDALAAAQAEYYRAQAANVGKPTPRTYLPGEQEAIDLKNQQLRMELEGRDPMSLYRQQTVAQNQAELDYKRQQDALVMQQRQSEADLARQQAAWRTASDMIEQQMKMAPTAARPGQEYWQGWGPGEAWSVLRPKLGLPYDPEKFKAPMLQFDPEEAWRRAMGMYGGQR